MCKWTSEKEEVVLEIQEEGQKHPRDGEVGTWADLLKDTEELGAVDVTINSHELVRPSVQGAFVMKQVPSLRVMSKIVFLELTMYYVLVCMPLIVPCIYCLPEAMIPTRSFQKHRSYTFPGLPQTRTASSIQVSLQPFPMMQLGHFVPAFLWFLKILSISNFMTVFSRLWMPADHCVVYGGCSSIKRPKKLDPSLPSELQSLVVLGFLKNYLVASLVKTFSQ